MPNSLKSFSNITRCLIGVSGAGMVAIATGCSSSISTPTELFQGSASDSAAESSESQPEPSASEPQATTEAASQNATDQNATDQSLAYRFDPSQVEPGDRLLGLEVVDVEVSSFGSDAYVGTVEFRGEVTLSGTYSPQTALVGSERAVPCFFVSEVSNTQLPRFSNDERNPWFCFTNPDAVQAAFGNTSTEQPATIVVDAYKTVYIPSDVYNEARFVRMATP